MPLASPIAIEPVRRAFAVLAALNGRRASTLTELSTETGLPKPTLSRLLETLVALGYAAQVSRRLGYRVTDRVLTLSGGIRFVDHLVDVAAPLMRKFTRDHGWPLYLGTISHGAMVIRYSTAPESPMSFEAAGYNQRAAPLASAIGRAYLAFCPEEERAAILREIGATGRDARTGVRQEAALDAAFQRIRRDGYAVTVPARPSRLNGIAVPIQHGGHVLGCVSLRYPKSVMTEADATRRYVPPLTALARAAAARAFKTDVG
ncbi:MAG: helix-turn-helix domain-containing protein [Rhodospirillales bacterium]|nr:helix-turn-helix domain-containing protein [Rhodospirillales bacterium]